MRRVSRALADRAGGPYNGPMSTSEIILWMGRSLSVGALALALGATGCRPREKATTVTVIPSPVATESNASPPAPTATRDAQGPRIVVEAFPASVMPAEGLKIVATAQDAGGVAGMTLLVDGHSRITVEGGSLRHNLDTRVLSSGEHALIVRARDEAGNASQVERRFVVVAPTLSPTPEPTATLTATTRPTATDVSPTPTITATATVVRRLDPVRVSWGQREIMTYDYSAALYSDPEGAGHPYPLLHRDRVGPARPQTYQELTIANDLLELTFLPELGGRLYQIRHLPSDQTLLYNNAVIKPTHWGPVDQGWWLAVGGMEWCLPVSEHGYLTAEPWDCRVERLSDGGATVWLSAKTHDGIAALVGVTLRSDDARLEITTRLRNTANEVRSPQYWINAMLAPRDNHVGSEMRFYYPCDQMQVHSCGDDDLGGERDWIGWPLAGGRDLSNYGDWGGIGWLGLFAPALETPFNAAYDLQAEIGLLRVYPPEVAKGSKLFAFAPDAGLEREYTDDGGRYLEMWGGLPRTFWSEDDVPIGPGAEIVWSEWWYPVWRCPDLVAANEVIGLGVRRDGGLAHLTLYAPRRVDSVVSLTENGAPIGRWEMSLDAGQSRQWDAPPQGNGALGVSVSEADGDAPTLFWSES